MKRLKSSNGQPNKRPVHHEESEETASDNFSDEDAEMDMDEYEELMQATQAEKVRLEKRKKSTKVAQVGALDYVVLVNFMCHGHLRVELCPNVNFITGHNGSGKSAVLTAITICLGGKASSTNRATSLKGFIKEGSDRAEITVRLRNRGPEAYKPDLYGDSITITRGITKNNTSDYKLMSHQGKLISKLKSEVTNLCDHFAIQPDNPLLILSQDAAKQFLASSKPEERYKFFLRGTQLQQLMDDYEATCKHLKTIKQSLDIKRSIKPEIERHVLLAHEKYTKMEVSINLESNLNKLMREIAWSQVYDAEDEMNACAKTKSEIEKKIGEAVERIEREKIKIEEIDGEYERLKKIVDEYRRRGEPTKNRCLELQSQMEIVKKESLNIISDEKALNTEILKLKKSRELIVGKIEEERKKDLQGNSVALRAQKAEELVRLEQLHSQIEGDIQQCKYTVQERNLDRLFEDAENDFRGIRQEHHQTEYESKRIADELRHSQRSSNNRLSYFGSNVVAMVHEIDRMSQQKEFLGEKPVGPIGAHINITDHKWTTTLDECMGAMTPYTFIVQHPKDVSRLQAVFERFEYGRRDRSNRVTSFHDIFVARPDPSFDYRSGVPPIDDRYVTVLDVLEIENPLVRQVLITNFSCEGIILVSSRSVGEQLMFGGKWPRNVIACFDCDGYRIGHRGRGNAAFSSNKGSRDYGFGGVCVNDGKKKIAYLNNLLEEKRRNLIHVEERLKFKEDEFNRLKRERETIHNNMNRLSQDLRPIKAKIGSLRAELDAFDQSFSVSIVDEFVAEKLTIESKIETLKSQFPAILNARRSNQERQELLRSQLLKVKTELDNIGKETDDFVAQMSEMSQKKVQHLSNVDHYQDSMRKYELKLEKCILDYNKLKQTFEEMFDKAREYCDGQVLASDELTYSTTERTEKAIRETRAALESRNHEVGSVEEALMDLKEKTEKRNNLIKEISELEQLFKVVTKSIAIRRDKWLNLRSFISRQTSIYFAMQLERRDFEGSLRFDHDKGRLHVIIRTKESEMAASQSMFGNRVKRVKDPKSLSGGEKSFSTVCLLLALWNAMASPIRGLDEFDVFMDPVNRKVATDMLIDSAADNPETQFILITPQSMSQVSWNNAAVKITKLKDPRERWQGGQQIIRSDFTVGTS